MRKQIKCERCGREFVKKTANQKPLCVRCKNVYANMLSRLKNTKGTPILMNSIRNTMDEFKRRFTF